MSSERLCGAFFNVRVMPAPCFWLLLTPMSQPEPFLPKTPHLPRHKNGSLRGSLMRCLRYLMLFLMRYLTPLTTH